MLCCESLACLLSGMSLGFLVCLVWCRLSWGLSGTVMPLGFVCTYAGGASLPGATSGVLVGHGSQLCPWFQVSPKQHNLHVGKTRLFQNKHFLKKGSDGKALNDD